MRMRLTADAGGRAMMATGLFDEATVTAKFAAGAITTGILKDGLLAASTAGRAKMATGYFTEAKANDAFAAGAIDTGLLKAGLLTAAAAGRAKMATDFFDAATAADKIAAAAIPRTKLAALPVTADPGTGQAIPVTQDAQFTLTTGAGAETNTLAIPTFAGQRIDINLGTAGGGTRTITSAQAINQAGNTTMAFTQADDCISLLGVNIAGVLRWRVLANDGVTLG